MVGEITRRAEAGDTEAIAAQARRQGLCHSADVPSGSVLKQLLQVGGGRSRMTEVSPAASVGSGGATPRPFAAQTVRVVPMDGGPNRTVCWPGHGQGEGGGGLRTCGDLLLTTREGWKVELKMVEDDLFH